MEESIVYAKKYLEDLLSFFGLNTDVYATSEDDVITLEVPSTHLNGFLIGQRGDTMRAMQFIVSNALKNQNFPYTRVNVDVAGYKKQRAERLGARAEEWMKRVKETGQPMDLKPMSAVDRRTVHQVAQEYGLTSESVGEGRDRHIVLALSEEAGEQDDAEEAEASAAEAPNEPDDTSETEPETNTESESEAETEPEAATESDQTPTEE